ncbi:hypothetical protein FGM00_16275 [Aggregatimonas sangjinii]|uniref:Lipoprotein n=1 Tax=Aggregatimonas sangjinii TaxID=2583587 RepID=A0A5B7SW92_9FLAO|nr:hypothetical protein [Aggregatimonas sangjinii]QCX01589.1 hypothetical protein FGM00_16275 [Aggregatimonas sangjinii]
MRTITKRKITKSKLLLMSFSAAILLMYGCGKDSVLNPLGDCFGGNWAEQYADELVAWSNAATSYSEDPTPTKCSEYKAAAKNYLDALKEVAGCVPTASKAEINDAINEAKAEVDREGCD